MAVLSKYHGGRIPAAAKSIQLESGCMPVMYAMHEWYVVGSPLFAAYCSYIDIHDHMVGEEISVTISSYIKISFSAHFLPFFFPFFDLRSGGETIDSSADHEVTRDKISSCA